MTKKKKKKTKLLIKDALLCTLFSWAIMGVLALVFFNLSVFNPIRLIAKDFNLLDVYQAHLHKPNQNINTDIVVINIEKANRYEIAILLDSLQKYQPKVIGVDAIFKAVKHPHADSLLANQINKPNIINAYYINEDYSYDVNSMVGFNIKNAGYTNFNFTDNRIIRNLIPTVDINEDTHSAFAIQVAKSYLGSSWSNNYKKKAANNVLIDYKGNHNSFITLGHKAFLDGTKDIVKNKIVLLGYVGTPTGNPNDIEDKHFTPINKIVSSKSTPDMFGVIIHANIIAMFIEDRFVYQLPTFWIVVISFVFSFIALLYFIKLKAKKVIRYRLQRDTIFLVFSILLMWLVFLLYNIKIVIQPIPILITVLLSCSYITYYKALIRFIKSKRKWKSYLK